MGGVDALLPAVEHLRRHRRETDDPRALAMMLYASWYARPQPAPEVPWNFPADLVQALRAADATGREWDGGWRADRVAPDGRVIALRGSEVRMADRCDYVAPAARGVLPRPGDLLIMSGRRDRVDDDGAWWRTGGRAWRFTRAVPALVRLYWSFELELLPELVRRLTGVLAADGRPWLLKSAADPAVHARADATVLYLDREALEELAPRIDGIAGALQSHARGSPPPLTLAVHPGVAVAMDPGPGESFGEHRCRLLVEGFRSASAEDNVSVLAAIVERLSAEGIDPGRTHAARTDLPLPWER